MSPPAGVDPGSADRMCSESETNCGPRKNSHEKHRSRAAVDRNAGRRIRSARSQSIQSEKISDFIAAETHVRLTGTGSKRTIGPKDLTPGLTLPQTGSC